MLDRILIEPSAFTEKQQILQGKIKLNELHERVWSPDLINLEEEVSYTLNGGRDTLGRMYLQLMATGNFSLCCQRCMNSVGFELSENVRIVLFENEDKLDEAMLSDDELDGMLLEKELDVLTLLEDQILMALPFSPKHDDCGNADLEHINKSKTNPFAVLAGVRKTV